MGKKFQPSTLLLSIQPRGVNMLLSPLKVKIQVVWKLGFFVLKRSVFEPRSQRSNQNKDPNSSDREIFQKLSKIGHMAQTYISAVFGRFLGQLTSDLFFYYCVETVV